MKLKKFSIWIGVATVGILLIWQFMSYRSVLIAESDKLAGQAAVRDCVVLPMIKEGRKQRIFVLERDISELTCEASAARRIKDDKSQYLLIRISYESDYFFYEVIGGGKEAVHSGVIGTQHGFDKSWLKKWEEVPDL
jgi:hypothetical protein